MTEQLVDLKFHRKRCNTCDHYRIEHNMTSCAHPTKGRLLSVNLSSYADYARYCPEWRKGKVKRG